MLAKKRRTADAVNLYVPGRTTVKVLAIIAIFYAAAAVAIELAPVFLSLAIAVFLAVAADPAVRYLQRRGMGRGSAVAIFMAALLVMVLAILALFLPPLVEQGDKLVREAPQYIEQVRENETFRRVDSRFHVLDKATQELEGLPAKVGAQLGDVVGAIAASVFGTVTVLFLMALLLLRGGEIVEGAARIFPQITHRRWWGVIRDVYSSVGSYVAGVLGVATVAGLTLLVVMLILGMPNPLPLALWMMLFDLVPLVGATIGALPAIIVAFVAGGHWGGLVTGIAIIVFNFVYQQLENAVIYPAIVGKAVQLSPLLVFISILMGAQLLGVLGAVLAIPFAGIVQIVLRELVFDDSPAEVVLPSIDDDDDDDPPIPGPV